MPRPTLLLRRQFAAVLCVFTCTFAAGSCARHAILRSAAGPADNAHAWQVIDGSATALASRLPSALVPVALSTIQASTAAGYEIVPVAPSNDRPRPAGAQYHASNRRHGVDITFTAAGVSVNPGPRGAARAAALTMHLTGYGTRGSADVVEPGTWHADGSRASREVVSASGTLTEWYVNGPFGLEQGFTLPAPPAPRPGVIAIELTVGDDWKATQTSPGAIELRGGADTLRYGHLFAADAAGRALGSTLTADGQRIVLTVDVTGAQYPVTVDPFIERQKLLAPDGAPNDLFGFGMAVDGDTALIGATGKTQNQGAVFVFTRTASGWSFVQQLTGSEDGPSDRFGRSLALEGDTALIASSTIAAGIANTGQGLVYHFARSGGFFFEVQKIRASDGAARHAFGSSLAFDGTTLVVGAPGSTAAGGAYVFTRTAGLFAETQKLVPTLSASVREFGAVVAVSGGTVVVGAPGTTVNGVIASGAAFVFVRAGSAFTETQTLTVAESGGLRFAEQVDVAADTALASLRLATVSGRSRQGAVFVFQRTTGVFSQTQRLTSSDGAADDNFGSSMRLDGPDAAYIAAPIHDAQRGALYVFKRVGGNFAEVQKLTASDGGPGEQFGFAAPDGGTLLVSAGAFNSLRGAVYAFEDSQTLNPPTGLSASVAGQLVTLRWNPVAGALSYRLAAGLSPGASNAFNGNVGNVTTLVATAPNGTYFVRVHAVGVSGESGPSAEITVAVGGLAPCTQPPPAPTFQVPTVNGSTVGLAWTAATGATSYAIEAGAQSGLVNLANFSTGNTATSFTAVAVPRGTYFVRVRGQNACGTGGASNERVVVVP